MFKTIIYYSIVFITDVVLAISSAIFLSKIPFHRETSSAHIADTTQTYTLEEFKLPKATKLEILSVFKT